MSPVTFSAQIHIDQGQEPFELSQPAHGPPGGRLAGFDAPCLAAKTLNLRSTLVLRHAGHRLTPVSDIERDSSSNSCSHDLQTYS